MSDNHLPWPGHGHQASAPLDQYGQSMLWSPQHQNWVAQPAPQAVQQQPAPIAQPFLQQSAPPIIINNAVAVGGRTPIGVKGPNHMLHLVLTIVTFGIWGIVWLFVIIRNKQRPVY